MSESDLRKNHEVLVAEFMVATGELTTGMVFYGPFSKRDAAGAWASKNLKDGTPYRVHTLHRVKE